MITLHIEFFAALREQAGATSQTLRTDTRDAQRVYELLAEQHGFVQTISDLKLAVNDEFTQWSHRLSDGDRLVFIPPVSGG